jgi:capsular polysaccharide transport system permease protein
MRARSAFSIQRDVVFAIFIREMNARFSSYTFGNIWILIEPILMMTVFVVLFGARGRGEFGYVEPPVFILAGFLPFRVLWNNTMTRNKSALSGARGLLGYRQVRVFDLFLTRTLVEGGIFLTAGTVLVTGMLWLGFDAMPRDILTLLWFGSVLWMFAASFGIIICVISGVAREVDKFISILSMPLMFLSAVFYPMTIVPEPYRTYLAYNPLVHASEAIREAWLPIYTSPVLDTSYLYAWTLCLMAFAISSYRLRWRKMIAA